MAIKWEKLTVKSQEAIQGAQSHAAENGNPEVLPLHLMAALLEDREGIVIPVLDKVGVPVQQFLSGINSSIDKLPKVQGGSQPGLSGALQKVLEQSFKEAEKMLDQRRLAGAVFANQAEDDASRHLEVYAIKSLGASKSTR